MTKTEKAWLNSIYLFQRSQFHSVRIHKISEIRAENMEKGLLEIMGNLSCKPMQLVWKTISGRYFGLSKCPCFNFSTKFYMLEFCSFHPGEPEYPNIQFKNSTLPMGEYPCCGELALRFQPLFQVCISCSFLFLSDFIFFKVFQWL